MSLSPKAISKHQFKVKQGDSLAGGFRRGTLANSRKGGHDMRRLGRDTSWGATAVECKRRNGGERRTGGGQEAWERQEERN